MNASTQEAVLLNLVDNLRRKVVGLEQSLAGLGAKATRFENDREYNAELVRERDARIAELEAALAASNADADALFEWANNDNNHPLSCDIYTLHACTCELLDDLRNHEKLREVKP